MVLSRDACAQQSAGNNDEPRNDEPRVERREEGRERNRDPRAEGKGRSPRGAKGSKGGGSGLGNYTEPPPANQVPDHLFNIVLGRPTADSITVRVFFHQPAVASIAYGLDSGKLSAETAKETIAARTAQDFVLKGLQPDSRYYYRLEYRRPDSGSAVGEEHTFHTQRAPGSPFVFTVTSDSHLDENTSGEVYLRTLANALSDVPDFHFELGDTFMTGKYGKPEYSEPQYLAQRYYLGSLCHSAALFFALGNHDGESGSRGSTEWATRKRLELIPNPIPNHFYSGNRQEEPGMGVPQDYYAWEWGDAMFLVLDPFRYTRERSNGEDHWSWTLGESQYAWLRRALEESKAAYKFVFLHHLVGGVPPHARGGIEAVPFWEWGGKGRSGEDEFAAHRPGWEVPIHELLVRHGVSIVFHGHDHMFIKQDLDGIVYQLVPQPGHPRSGNTRSASEYGYLSGETQSSSGHIRVRVGRDGVRADYVRSYLGDSQGQSSKNGEVSFSYVLSSNAENQR